jgi:NAD(P)-dependent dehydrogenase (short-subunit alcohol dehydrogenase family)
MPPSIDDRVSAPIDFAQRHVLVTGASRGIGAAIAAELARCRARVTLVSRRLTEVETMRMRLVNADSHTAIEADVTDPRAVPDMVAESASRLGPVYGLVNNAGGGEAAAFLEADDTHWHRMIDVNLMSAVFCTRAVLPAMRSRGEGRVVNVASTASLRGFRHVAAYAAAKHALLGLTRSLALEMERDGIVVSAVCPGYTETQMLAQSMRDATVRTGRSADEIRARYVAGNTGGRLVQPEEVARVVAWLCSAEATDMNGRHVLVDGGPLEVSA